jgi:hypothetical protein
VSPLEPTISTRFQFADLEYDALVRIMIVSGFKPGNNFRVHLIYNYPTDQYPQENNFDINLSPAFMGPGLQVGY